MPQYQTEKVASALPVAVEIGSMRSERPYSMVSGPLAIIGPYVFWPNKPVEPPVQIGYRSPS